MLSLGAMLMVLQYQYSYLRPRADMPGLSD